MDYNAERALSDAVEQYEQTPGLAALLDEYADTMLQTKNLAPFSLQGQHFLNVTLKMRHKIHRITTPVGPPEQRQSFLLVAMRSYRKLKKAVTARADVAILKAMARQAHIALEAEVVPSRTSVLRDTTKHEPTPVERPDPRTPANTTEEEWRLWVLACDLMDEDPCIDLRTLRKVVEEVAEVIIPEVAEDIQEAAPMFLDDSGNEVSIYGIPDWYEAPTSPMVNRLGKAV
jgi:hypothetical protein